MDSIIKNVKTPLLIKNTLKWEVLNWNLDKWRDILGNEELTFCCGKNGFTLEPQYGDLTTANVKMTFEKFLNSKSESEWYYFSYKHLEECLVNCEELRSHITWSDFGFPELGVEDSTIWIGSKGAHTPCHMDTYGCNVVAQIYGRKRWMLFPPEEDLESTRIPYEESSIFSKINFFAPSATDCKGEKNCYNVVLHPGDVLVVPHRWWHFVENLELAISVNTWIKLPVDYEERVKEAIVRTSMKLYLTGFDTDIIRSCLASTAEFKMFNGMAFDCIDIITECLKQYKENKVVSSQTINLVNATETLKNFSNIEQIQPLTKHDYQKLLEDQRNRFMGEAKTNTLEFSENVIDDFKKFLEAAVHSDVVQLIYEKLKKS